MRPSYTAVLIAGPTASGKSALAIELAQSLKGTVINTDSMQVYRDLSILTARPSAEDMSAVPHRLYGDIDGALNHSVGRWLADAAAALAATRAEGRVPIFCGGTGLYFKALEQGIAQMPQVPEGLRAQIRSDMSGREPGFAHKHLHPDDAIRLRAGDTQRILRALEVHAATGRSLASWQAEPHSAPLVDNARTLKLFLSPERKRLFDRINRRFETMMENGAIEEISRLAARNLDSALPIMRAHGVPGLVRALRGEASLAEAVATAQSDTRHYAKRQFTWFRHQGPDYAVVAPDEAAAFVRAQWAKYERP